MDDHGRHPMPGDEERDHRDTRQAAGAAPLDARALAEVARMAEALVFASAEPVSEKLLAERLPRGTPVGAVMEKLRADYAARGINLVRVENAWAFRTAGDLSFLMSREAVDQKKLSRAALEVLAIIAYHQPVTPAEMGTGEAAATAAKSSGRSGGTGSSNQSGS